MPPASVRNNELALRVNFRVKQALSLSTFFFSFFLSGGISSILMLTKQTDVNIPNSNVCSLRAISLWANSY
ncbi:MAG: hypothetical protein ACTS6G_00390 [Candidatus Hodgkinia cicadicola]